MRNLVISFLVFWGKPNEKFNILSNNDLIKIFIWVFPLSMILNIIQIYFQVTIVILEDFEFTKYVMLPTGISWASLMLVGVYLGLGVFEEFVFRYWLKEKWLGKYLPILTWLSFLLFVLVHAKPWELEVGNWIYMPLMTLTPIFGGFILTYVRLHGSIKKSILFHCAHNFLGVIIYIGLGLIFGETASNVQISF